MLTDRPRPGHHDATHLTGIGDRGAGTARYDPCNVLVRHRASVACALTAPTAEDPTWTT